MEKTVTDEGRGDCVHQPRGLPRDADKVAEMVRERFGTRIFGSTTLGQSSGAHSGPGTLALFYLGTER